MPAASPEIVDLPPAFTGAAGRAWTVDLDAAYVRLGRARAEGAEVCAWVVEARWAHPVWHSYWIDLAHLRPVAGHQRPFTVYLAGATHELVLMALDPDALLRPMIGGGPVQALAPVNFAAQFVAENDAMALRRVELAVQAICDGRLSPDTDFRDAWIALFGAHMILP